MKTGILKAGIFLFLPLFYATAQQRPVDLVHPLIGTDPLPDKAYLGGNPAPGEELYSGTVNPCAMVPDPNGYLCVGPVTGFDGAFHVRGSGYRFSDASIMGFTQMNGEYSDVNRLLFMPTVGPVKTEPGKRTEPATGYRSAKDSLRETASPGYYSVVLSRYGIRAEMTATANCGLHRYTFPSSQQANLLIDLANARPQPTGSEIRILDPKTIEGSQSSGSDTVYFRAEFSRAFTSFGSWQAGTLTPGSKSASGPSLGGYVTFGTKAGEQILVKVGTSTKSQAEAAANLAKEIPGMDFDATREQARQQWSRILDRVVVEGGTHAERINFYTAVYRMAAGPKYSWFPSYDANGMLLARGSDWVAERAARARWHWGGGYWGPGNVAGLVGLYRMGFHSIDLKAAYAELREQAMYGGGAAGAAYRQYGFIPAEAGVKDYVNRSIGLAHDDHALAELAALLGNDEDEHYFLERAKNYTKLFNPELGFFVPRHQDGAWILPLDPIEPHAEDIYREGNAWNYLWFNSEDIPGLIGLLGGREAFRAKLDQYFTANYQPRMPLRDLTGVIGFYFHGNEQYRQNPYLYNYAGEAWKTQALVRKIERELYRPVPAGLCGMDDYGDLEGWYVTSALGFLQVDLSSDFYEIGSPLFSKATIQLEGKTPGSFVIEAHHVSALNPYIQSATLNGKPLNAARFRQSDMIPGGSLVFEMGAKPNLKWGVEGPR